MSVAVFGLVGLIMGLFCLAISKPLAKLVTYWNLFLPQDDPTILQAYRSKKRRGIRLVAMLFLVLGVGFMIAGLIAWSLGVA